MMKNISGHRHQRSENPLDGSHSANAFQNSVGGRELQYDVFFHWFVDFLETEFPGYPIEERVDDVQNLRVDELTHMLLADDLELLDRATETLSRLFHDIERLGEEILVDRLDTEQVAT